MFSFVVHFSHSVMSNSLWPHRLHMPGYPVHHQLLVLSQTHVHQVGDAIQLSHPLSSSSPPAFNLAHRRSLFLWVSSSCGQTIGVADLASVLPKNIQGLISFRIDWSDLLAVQGTLKSLLQPHSSKASILQCSAFFIVQLSYPYMAIGKTIALTRWNFVSKAMPLGKLSGEELMLLNCGVGEDSWESLGLQGDPTSPS